MALSSVRLVLVVVLWMNVGSVGSEVAARADLHSVGVVMKERFTLPG
ncbi:hypothetical protein WA016_02582 [Myxococcus stipitatus]